MLRKPDSKAPLPAFGQDDDESARTGEYKPLAHPLPSFAQSDELPRFPSMIDPRELGGEPLPSFASVPEPKRPRREPVKLADDPRTSLPRDIDVAATLEKRPMTARAADRILAQLDRIPQRPDETGEIDLEDVLEEVYAEPPLSRRAVAAAEPLSRRPEPAPVSRRSEPVPPPMRRFANEDDGPSHPAPPMAPPPPPSFTGTDFPQPAPRSFAPSPASAPPLPGSSTAAMAPHVASAYPGAAMMPGSSTVPLAPPSAYPSAPGPYASPPASRAQVPGAASGYPAPPPSGYPSAPHHSAAAYAHTVPAGYVLVPETSLTGRDHALPLTADAALVRPLPVATTDAPKETSVLTKVLAGGLLLGLSALAGGAASIYLVPEKAPDPAPSASQAPAPQVSPVAPSASVSAPSSSVAPPASVLAPLGAGWPLAPATVPPGAGSMSPPPPSGAPTPEGAAAPAPSALPAPSASGSSAPLASTMGRIVFGPARVGHRVWIDGAMVGESVAPIVVKCGKRHVRIGSSAGGQTVDVPCGGEIVVK